MATVVITSLTGYPVYLSDLYLTLKPHTAITINRATAQLESMKNLMKEIQKGSISVSITPTPEEIASGYFDSFGNTNIIPPAAKANAVVQMPLVGSAFSAPLTMDQILPTFACSLFGGGLLDLGATLPTPSFTASYVRTPAAAVLTDNAGSPAKSVISTPSLFTSNGSFVHATFGNSVVFTLTADEGGPNGTATAMYIWVNRAFAGVAASGQTGASFILSLPGHLQSGKPDSFTVNPSSSQKIYYATRSAFGLCKFTVGGFTGGFARTQQGVSVTNSNGATENFDLYESDNVGLGATTVGVS